MIWMAMSLNFSEYINVKACQITISSLLILKSRRGGENLLRTGQAPGTFIRQLHIRPTLRILLASADVPLTLFTLNIWILS